MQDKLTIKPYRIYANSESSVTVSFGDEISEDINAKVHALFDLLKGHSLWLDVIPAYTTVTVVFDLVGIKKFHSSAFEFVKEEIEKSMTQCHDDLVRSSRIVKIPVCYDPTVALDLRQMAIIKNITEDELIQLHTRDEYRVYMIGFLPGFAYMGKVNLKLATPRLEKPRSNVAAGSVGIAGQQTGIYPLDSPGGWNIIGKTPVKMFDVANKNPAFLTPGDRVKFVPISLSDFEAFNQHNYYSLT